MGDNDFIGIKGIKGNLPCGVGFVIIPDNLDIDDYKKDVYDSGRISINGGYGHANFYNILIDREVLQRIRFPKKSGEMGSPVVWVNIPKHNEAVVVACLKYDEDFFDLSEFRKRTTATDGKGNIVDLDLDAKNGKLIISGSGVSKKMEMNIELNSKNNDSIFRVVVNGEILTRASKRMVDISQDRIEQAVADKSGIVKRRIVQNQEETVIQSETIRHNEGNEPMVLGDTLANILKDLIDQINLLTVPTGVGPSGVPINKTEFTEIKKRIDDIKSQFSKLE